MNVTSITILTQYHFDENQSSCVFAGGSDYFECHPPFKCPHRTEAMGYSNCDRIKGLSQSGGWVVENQNIVQERGGVETSPRRAPVQGNWKKKIPDGTIEWNEHQETWEAYSKKYGKDQSAEDIARRAGFSYEEIKLFLGHEPKTWKPR